MMKRDQPIPFEECILRSEVNEAFTITTELHPTDFTLIITQAHNMEIFSPMHLTASQKSNCFLVITISDIRISDIDTNTDFDEDEDEDEILCFSLSKPNLKHFIDFLQERYETMKEHCPPY